MKYAKYLEIARKNRWLEETLCWTLGCPFGHPGIFKEFIRTQVGFIAARPFQSLDQGSVDSSVRSELPNTSFQHEKKKSWVSTKYYISLHVLGDPKFKKMEFTGLGGKSISQCIEGEKTQYKMNEKLKDTTLVFDRVLKRVSSGSDLSGQTNVTFEFYEFPDEITYVKHPLVTPKAPLTDSEWYERESTRRYVSGEEPLPIMPSGF